MADLIPVYSAADLMQAQMLRDELDERGIAAWIINEALAGGAGELPLGWSSSPRVVVAQEDVPKAREIAVAFDRAFAGRRRTTVPEKESAAPVVDQDPWPRCPMCASRRRATCRICGTSGTDFPRGYQVQGDDSEPGALIVVCPMCDEPFAPRFYKHCEHCSYEFEDGIDVPRPAQPIEELRTDMRRIWLVLAGMALLGLATVGYLFWLDRQ